MDQLDMIQQALDIEAEQIQYHYQLSPVQFPQSAEKSLASHELSQLLNTKVVIM